MANFLEDYEPVEDRLREFHKDYPKGRVITTLVDHVAGTGEYIVRAELFRNGEDWPAASGLAHDSVAQLPPNMKASALEVCETSAIGRALANLGYAAKGKRPSREEMSKASPAAGPSDGVATKGEDVNAERGQNGGAASPAGGTTSAEGEAAATEPGEGQPKPSLGPTTYPVDPVDCDHLYATGVPAKVKIGKKELCRLCGTPWIAAMEGTTADLGPA